MLDRHSRRRPFSTLMKRLASLKNSTSDSGPFGAGKKNALSPPLKPKKTNTFKNNPYPTSGRMNGNANVSVANSTNGHLSFYTPPSGRSVDCTSSSHSKQSLPVSNDDQHPPTLSNRSAAPTMSTNPETVNSEAAQSKAGTSATAGGISGVGGGDGSTFSSPAPSVRSLTTTLTTIQSAAPSNILNNQTQQATAHSQHHHSQTPTVQFSHQFPSSPPASAIPSHVVGQTSGGHPATYSTATANNLLSDNASILTLASSSKRRRRNSLDTNASVRALAPSSIFGGSRESLPLSVLSGNAGDPASAAGLHHRPSVGGVPNTERASVYSSTGIGPALSSERNSLYAGKQNNPGDGGSIRSGLIGHGRNDSITGSIGGIAANSPLSNSREVSGPGRISRRNSARGDFGDENHEGEKDKQFTRVTSRGE